MFSNPKLLMDPNQTIFPKLIKQKKNPVVVSQISIKPKPKVS